MVSCSLFAHDGSEHDNSLPHKTYTDIFYEKFPYYLAIGMTHEQYWDGDSSLVKYYRRADEIRMERLNQEKWLQGMYIYEAICDASPILHSFSKKGSKPYPYSDKPYPISDSQIKKRSEEKEKAVSEKGKLFMESFMKLNNDKFKKNNMQ